MAPPRTNTRRRSVQPPGTPWSRALALLGLGVFGVGLTVALVLIGLFAWYGRGLPDVHGLRTAWRPPQTTRVLDSRGALLAELFIERRTVVPLERLPRHLVTALLAAEDARFYEHTGLAWTGMLRALVVNLRHGTVAQGASTITQQVVKNVLLSPERTLARKVREVLLARAIERELHKNDILYLYVNHIAFGHGRNGVEEAARFYFGHGVERLTLAESALLAGIPKSPVHYSPVNDMDAALRRRHWILGQMVSNGFVTAAEAEAADREPVRLAARDDDHDDLAPEVIELVRRTLAQVAGDDALRFGRYTVTTTIDRDLQRAARAAVASGLSDLDRRHGYRGPLLTPGTRRPNASGNVLRGVSPPRDGVLNPGQIYAGVVAAIETQPPALVVRVGTSTGKIAWSRVARYANNTTIATFAPVGAAVRVSPDQRITPDSPGTFRLELGPQAAFVAIDPWTREVRAMVGAFESTPGMFNRATRAVRQPGSAFKPVLYSYALHSRRYTLASTVDPNPGCFGTGRRPWCPAESHAVEGVIEPGMRLREALAVSRNMVAARVMEALGPEPVIEHARALGITSPMPSDLSLALGSGGVTPIELVNAYATWAARGQYQDWYVIREIRGPDGRALTLPARAPARVAITPEEAWLVTSAMTSVIDRGTARSARSLGRPAAGKTGTTDRSRDAWFVGYTPDLVAGVWVGFDDRQPLGYGEEGARSAVPIWTSFMRDYVRARRPPAIEFARPEGVVALRIDPATGLLPGLAPADPLQAPVSSIEEYFLAGTEPRETAPVDAAVLAPVDASAWVPSEVIDAGATAVENPVAAPVVVEEPPVVVAPTPMADDAAVAPTD
ncbi:MAG: PBP1A family penicillin-binding protein [Deltaproteobacteria bacterium]|nr:PBP1A family penicillin-binding protein [Deltaproteobacteria bacterium]